MIETSRMRLKKATPEDAKTLKDWWNNGELMVSVGFKNGLGVSLEDVEKRLKRDDHVIMVAFDKETGEPIGEFSYGQMDMDAGTLRIGMKIANLDYQGKGYGKEGLRAFLFYLFESYALEAIHADTFTENTRARKLYEQFGAKKESIEKGYWTNPEGVAYDVIFYRIPSEAFYERLEHSNNE
ncbi:MAG: GNAT family N-acetyltransferase [Bacillota bacterium]